MLDDRLLFASQSVIPASEIRSALAIERQRKRLELLPANSGDHFRPGLKCLAVKTGGVGDAETSTQHVVPREQSCSVSKLRTSELYVADFTETRHSLHSEVRGKHFVDPVEGIARGADPVEDLVSSLVANSPPIASLPLDEESRFPVSSRGPELGDASPLNNHGMRKVTRIATELVCRDGELLHNEGHHVVVDVFAALGHWGNVESKARAGMVPRSWREQGD